MRICAHVSSNAKLLDGIRLKPIDFIRRESSVVPALSEFDTISANRLSRSIAGTLNFFAVTLFH
jgi:hypothetical protein